MPTELRLKTGLHNTSEIGRLRKVMLHYPGRELENLMPEYLERLLFDDIPYLKVAQAEHDAFANCLRDNGADVVYLKDLVTETIQEPEIRQELVDQFLDEAGIDKHRIREILCDYFSGMADSELVDTLMAGVRKSDVRGFETGKLSDYLSFQVRRLPLPHRPHAQPLFHPGPLRHHRHRRVPAPDAHGHPEP